MKKFILPMLLVTLISCGKSDEQKTQEKAKEASKRVDQLNAIADKMISEYGVSLNSYILLSSRGTRINSFEYKHCIAAEKLVKKYITSANRLLEILSSKNINHPDEYKVKIFLSNANTLDASIDCNGAKTRELTYQSYMDIEKAFETESDLEFTDIETAAGHEIGLTYTRNYSSTFEGYKKAQTALASYIDSVQNSISIKNRTKEVKVKIEVAQKYLQLFTNQILSIELSTYVDEIHESYKNIENLSYEQLVASESKIEATLIFLTNNRQSMEAGSLYKKESLDEVIVILKTMQIQLKDKIKTEEESLDESLKVLLDTQKINSNISVTLDQ